MKSYASLVGWTIGLCLTRRLASCIMPKLIKMFYWSKQKCNQGERSWIGRFHNDYSTRSHEPSVACQQTVNDSILGPNSHPCKLLNATGQSGMGTLPGDATNFDSVLFLAVYRANLAISPRKAAFRHQCYSITPPLNLHFEGKPAWNAVWQPNSPRRGECGNEIARARPLLQDPMPTLGIFQKYGRRTRVGTEASDKLRSSAVSEFLGTHVAELLPIGRRTENVGQHFRNGLTKFHAPTEFQAMQFPNEGRTEYLFCIQVQRAIHKANCRDIRTTLKHLHYCDKCPVKSAQNCTPKKKSRTI